MNMRINFKTFLLLSCARCHGGDERQRMLFQRKMCAIRMRDDKVSIIKCEREREREREKAHKESCSYARKTAIFICCERKTRQTRDTTGGALTFVCVCCAHKVFLDRIILLNEWIRNGFCLRAVAIVFLLSCFENS